MIYYKYAEATTVFSTLHLTTSYLRGAAEKAGFTATAFEKLAAIQKKLKNSDATGSGGPATGSGSNVKKEPKTNKRKKPQS